jgi:hypothetical protein
MSPPVRYEIPMYADETLRLPVGCCSRLVALEIFGGLLPRYLKSLRAISSHSAGVIVIGWLLFLAFMGVGLLCLTFLLGSSTNPAAYVTNAGVMKEGIVVAIRHRSHGATSFK